MIVKVRNARLAFAHLFQPQKSKDGNLTFNGAFILKPDDPQVKTIESAMRDVAVAKWGDKGEKILANLKKQKRVCLKDGNDNTNKEGEIYAGFEDMVYLSASNKVRPSLVGRDKEELKISDGKLYPGCNVIVSVEIWAQDNDHGQRINAGLRWVQFFKDGDAFAGGTPVSDEEFDDLGDGAEDDEDLA